MNTYTLDVAFLPRSIGQNRINQDNRRDTYDGRSTRGGETDSLPPQGDGLGPRLVGPGLADLRVPGDQLRDARHLRVHLRRAGVPERPADNGSDHLGNLGFVPGDRLYRARRHDPPGRRRLRLADQDPGQRHWLRDGCDRLVVHSLAVGADLRQHLVGSVVRAAVGDAQVDLAGWRLRVVRHAQRDLRGDLDHD